MPPAELFEIYYNGYHLVYTMALPLSQHMRGKSDKRHKSQHPRTTTTHMEEKGPQNPAHACCKKEKKAHNPRRAIPASPDDGTSGQPSQSAQVLKPLHPTVMGLAETLLTLS